jgi:hypothetical protein
MLLFLMNPYISEIAEGGLVGKCQFTIPAQSEAFSADFSTIDSAHRYEYNEDISIFIAMALRDFRYR